MTTVAAPGILANDDKEPGKTLSVVNPDSIGISPRFGTLDVNADGSLVYDAAPDACGVFTFDYKATDGECKSNEATVTFFVNC